MEINLKRMDRGPLKSVKMIDDDRKFKAVWVSHSSMGDFLKCPRLYYLHNVYKDPKTRKKISIVSPAMSLGSAVHATIEPLAKVKAEDRLSLPLLDIYEKEWLKMVGPDGLKGGFKNKDEENEFKERGRKMIERIVANPGPIKNKALRLKDDLPYYFLSEEENIILCGKVDWLQYVEKDDSLHILDFKTGKNEEKEDSLQLPIYLLLLNNLQKRKVSGASYWYLDRDDKPKEVELPDYEKAYKAVYDVALLVNKARAQGQYQCRNGEHGCYACRPYEAILKGEMKYVGVGEYGNSLWIEKD